MQEACERLGGEKGDLIQPKPRRVTPTASATRSPQGHRAVIPDVVDDRPRSLDSGGHDDAEYVKVGKEQQARERKRMGFRG
jgi:hypothetical protein